MDQQIQDLIDQMRDLVKSLKATSGTAATSGGMADNSVNKLINALGQVAVKLDGTKRTRAEELQAMKRFSANVNRATKQQDAQAEAIAKNIQKTKDATAAQAEAARISKLTAEQLAKEQLDAERKRKAEETKARNETLKDKISDSRRATSSSRALFDEVNSAGSSVDLLKTRFLDLGGNSLTAQAGLQLLAAGAEGVVKSLSMYTGALYKGERGAVTSAKALTQLATPVLDVVDTLGKIISFGSLFVPGGILVKGAVALGGALVSAASGAGKVALAFNETAAKQADDLFKSFRELSQVGAATAGGMDDVFSLVQTLGMTVAEIEDFNKLIVGSGTKLAMMGATAADGAKEFAQVAGGLYKSDLGRQLEMLGISAGEQREAALAYMNIQARTGQMQLKSTKQLIEESAKFAKELDIAAQLTGQTRKEQQAAREAALAETRFRAALIDAEQRGDQAEMDRLQRAQRMAAIAKGLGDERGFTGILQAAAGGGALATPEAVAAEMTYGVNQILSQPTVTDDQMLAQMGASVKIQQEQLAGINKYIGGIDALQTSVTASADLQKRAVLLAEGATKAGFTGPDAITKFLETEQGKRIGAGGDTRLMVEAGRAQQGAAMTMDSVVKSFNAAATIHDTASKTFKSAVDLFAKTVGAKAVVGGAPTTTAPLGGDSPQEILQAQVQHVKSTAETLAQLGEITLGDPDRILAEQATRADAIKRQDAENLAKATTVEKASVITAQAIEKTGEAMGWALDKIGMTDTGKRVTAVAQEARESRVASDTQYLKEQGRGTIDKMSTVVQFSESELYKKDKDTYNKYLDRKNELFKERLAEIEKDNSLDARDRKAARDKAQRDTQTQAQKEFAQQAQKAGAATVATATTPTASNAYMNKLIQAESGGRNIANRSGQGGTSTSTAFGLTQFTKGTFEGLVKKAAPTNPLYGKSWDDYKQDTNLQMEATRQLTDQNRGFLASKKLSTSDSALYLAHFLGPGGASKALSLPDSAAIADAVSPDQLAANPGLQSMATVGDLKAWADKKMGGVGYANGGIIQAKRGGTRITAGEGKFNEAVVPLPDGKTIPVSFDQEIIRALKQTTTPNTSPAPIVTPLLEAVSKLVSDIRTDVRDKTTSATPEVSAQAIATAMAAEFRSVIAEMLQQPRQSGDSSILVAAINDMVREQRTTNTISQRMLQVAQN